MIKQGLEMYAKHKMIPTRGWNAKRMMTAATEITGKSYKRRDYLKAAEDIDAVLKQVNDPDADSPCPSCGASDLGDPIPENIREHYSGTRWRKHVGIEDSTIYDGISWWRCWSCKHIWKRFPWSPEYTGA